MEAKIPEATASLFVPWEFRILQDVLKLKNQFLQKSGVFHTDFQEPRLLSVATYNVHMWMDPFDNEGEPLTQETDSVDRILKVIDEARPDVLLLQEFAPANFHFNNRLVRAGKAIPALQAMGYVKSVFCNVVPSWLESPVGNAIFVKASALDAEVCENGFKICKGLAEEIRTLRKAQLTSRVQGIYEGQQETRCFASIRLRVSNQVFIIVTTHLDIAAESQRLAQIKEILAHVTEQIQLAKLETQALRARNVRNQSYDFSEPVVVIAGDFNTVDPADIDAIEDEEERRDVVRMLNAINRAGGGVDFCELIRDQHLGVCAYLTKNAHHEAPKTDAKPETGPYVYRSVRVRGHTNWNLTKIDHVFIGQPAAVDALATQAFIHPEPASDHLMVFVNIPGDKKPLPYFYSETNSALQEQKEHQSIGELARQNELVRDVFEIDEDTGLVYYFPQIYAPSMGMTKRSDSCVLLGPALVPKGFGSWNQPSYYPSGEAKIIQDPARASVEATVPDELLYMVIMSWESKGKDRKEALLFARPFISEPDSQAAADLIGSVAKKKGAVALYVVTASQLRSAGIDVRVLRAKAPSQTVVSYFEEAAVLLNGEDVQWKPLGGDRKIMRAILGLETELNEDHRRAVYKGYLPLQPHSMEKTGPTMHRVFLSKSFADKQGRYIYLFPCKINVLGSVKPRNIRPLQDLQARYIGFHTRGAIALDQGLPSVQETTRAITRELGNQFQFDQFVESVDRMFAPWFASCSFQTHGDDVYQVASGSVQYLNSTRLSRYSRSYGRALQNGSKGISPAPWKLKFDNPLELLLLLTASATSPSDPQQIQAELTDYHLRLSGNGRNFYRELDFSASDLFQLAEQLMGWIQMDYLQREMVANAATRVQPLLFSESPEYIANTEREITLKQPVHTIYYPKKGAQKHEYTIGATWNNIIHTEGLVVYPLETYHVVPPLQRVAQSYEGYADCIDGATDLEGADHVKKVHRKHFIATRSVEGQTPPQRISWEAFRYLSESDTNRAHLDLLERRLAHVMHRGPKHEWYPDFPEGIASVLSRVVRSVQPLVEALLSITTTEYIPALLQTMDQEERQVLYWDYARAEIAGDREQLESILKQLKEYVEFSL